MKKVKSLNKEEVNFRNKKQRFNLYQRTFMKHNVESRLFTLQKESINLTLQTAATALDPSRENLLNLAESIGDVETCIEFIKMSIPKLQDASGNIRQNKLTSLKNRTDDEDEAKRLNPEAAKITEHEKPSEASVKAAQLIKEFSSSIPEKRSPLGFFRHCMNY